MEALQDDDVPFERKVHSNKGVATKLTPTKDAAMMDQALDWGFDFSYDDMAAALMELFDFTISAQAVADHLRQANWNVRATSRAEPLLRDDLGHFDARADFARERNKEKQTWRNWVDVDEKWFYTMAVRLLLKLPPGVATPKRYVRHKSHVPKTQFLCAMGRPQWRRQVHTIRRAGRSSWSGSRRQNVRGCPWQAPRRAGPSA